MIGWVSLAILMIATLAALILLGLPRVMLTLAGAALMLGATGYALQGSPDQPAHPALIDYKRGPANDPSLIDLRDRMLGKFSADWSYQVAADAITGSGDRRTAVVVLLGGIRKIPRSMALWVGLGSALADHDRQVSPATLLAFQHAARLQPLSPAPPFFLGQAYIRADNFERARALWARALALTPPRVSYRRDIALRLALLERLLATQKAEQPSPLR